MKTPSAVLSIAPSLPSRLPRALLIGAAALLVGATGLALGGARLRAPRFDLLAAAAPVIQLHVAAALTALVIGTVLMLRPKGVGLHKTLGWTWVIAMATVALSSFFIRTSGTFSWIHLLSGWTIIALPMGVAAIRGRNVKRHRRTMTGMFVGGLVIAGAFTFVPGRLMWDVFLK